MGMNNIVEGVLVRGASLCKTWKGMSLEEFGDLQGMLFPGLRNIRQGLE